MYEFFGAVPNPQPKPVSTCLGELEVWKCEPSASARDPCQSDEACSSSAESRTTFSNTNFRISTLPAHSILHTKQPPLPCKYMKRGASMFVCYGHQSALANSN